MAMCDSGVLGVSLLYLHNKEKRIMVALVGRPKFDVCRNQKLERHSIRKWNGTVSEKSPRPQTLKTVTSLNKESRLLNFHS